MPAPLPGHSLAVTTEDDGAVCECGQPFTHKIAGECDSFGHETIHLCDACYDKHKEYEKNRDRSGQCDWCNKEKPKLFNKRDIDEGSHGPVYLVCQECADAYNDRIREEMEELDERDYDGRLDDDDDGPWQQYIAEYNDHAEEVNSIDGDTTSINGVEHVVSGSNPGDWFIDEIERHEHKCRGRLSYPEIRRRAWRGMSLSKKVKVKRWMGYKADQQKP